MKNGKKSIVSLIICLCLVLSGMSAIAFADEASQGESTTTTGSDISAFFENLKLRASTEFASTDLASISASHNGHCTCINSDFYYSTSVTDTEDYPHGTPLTDEILKSATTGHNCTHGYHQSSESEAEKYESEGNASNLKNRLNGTTDNSDKKPRMYLENDITIDMSGVQSGQSWVEVKGHKTICLNGHKITVTGQNSNKNSRVFTIKNNASLTICDCSGGQAGEINGGGLVGGFYVASNASLTIFSGNITNFAATNPGGAICNDGTFNMYGGTILNNISINDSTDEKDDPYAESDGFGGGIYNNGGGEGSTNVGIVNIYGGKITGNKATDKVTNKEGTNSRGGGIYSEGTKAAVNIYGGTISDNIAEITTGTEEAAGGGIYIKEGTLNIDPSAMASAVNISALQTAQGLESNFLKKPNYTAPTITGNEAVASGSSQNNTVEGGGIYVAAGATCNITSYAGADGTEAIDPVILENNAKQGGGIFAASGSTLTITGAVTISRNTALDANGSGYGGGVYSMGTTTITNAKIQSNEATNGAGGGVYVKSGTTTISGCTIGGGDTLGNKATGNYGSGGGVYATAGDGTTTSLIIQSSGDGESAVPTTISHNQATNGGGVCSAATTEITGAKIQSNQATSGGGVYVDKGTTTISGCTIGGTEADANTSEGGGGVYAAAGTLTIQSSGTEGSTTPTTISHNKVLSMGAGGGVYVKSGTTTITGALIQSNIANNGGGVCSAATTTEITGATISSNTAVSNGGGIYSGGGTTTIKGCTIGGENGANTAKNGGGVYAASIATSLTITNSDNDTPTTISHNTATSGAGGGVWTAAATTITEAQIKSNSAANGGGVYVNGNTTTISGCTIGGTAEDETKSTGNTAAIGGGVYAAAGTLTIDKSGDTATTISYNKATGATTQTGSSGGGIYSAANTNITGATISSNQATSGGGVYVNGGTTTIKGCTIGGENGANTAKNGGGVYAAANSTLTIEKNDAGTATTISHNEATNGAGGGVWTAAANTTITEAQIKSNEATNGGGVYVEKGTTTISGCTIGGTAEDGTTSTGNTATNGGGVYAAANSTLTIEKNDAGTATTISHNEATNGAGGGVWTAAASTTITEAQIKSNHAASGGGVYVNGSTTTIKGCTIGGESGGNTAAIGGGVYAAVGTLTIQSSGTEDPTTPTTISHNEAKNGAGGGVFSAATTTITEAQITTNHANNGDGGGIYVGNGTTTISGCTIGSDTDPNAAKNGGGIYTAADATLIIDDDATATTSILHNQASTDGGGIYVGGKFYLSGETTTISDNKQGNNVSNNICLENGKYIGLYGDIPTTAVGVYVQGVIDLETAKATTQPLIAKPETPEGKEAYEFNAEDATKFSYDYEIDKGDVANKGNLYKAIPYNSTFVLDCMHAVIAKSVSEYPTLNESTDKGSIELTITPERTQTNDDGHLLLYRGDTVTFTAEIAKNTDNNRLYSVAVTDPNGAAVEYTKGETTENTSLSGSFTMPGYDTTITAIFETVYQISVTQPSNGSLSVSKEYAAQKEEIDITVSPNSGYSLSALNVKTLDGTPVAISSRSFLMPNENVVVSATFKKDVPKVIYNTLSYDANGGSGTMKSESVKSGVLFELPTTCSFTPPTGKMFAGWATSPDGDIILTNFLAISKNTTVYAIWTDMGPTEYTVTFDANGGTVVPPTMTTTNTKLPSLPTPTLEGKSFVGWFTEKTGGSLISLETEFTQDTTVYAQWADKETEEFEITFDANGGTVETATAKTVDGKLTSLPTPVLEGQQFLGWFLSKDFGTAVTTDTVFTQDTTVYAYWNQSGKEYTVTFDANGGNLAIQTATTVLGKLTVLPDPVSDTKTFIGWFTEKTDGTQITQDTVFNKDTTIYAQWLDGKLEHTTDPKTNTLNADIKMTDVELFNAIPLTDEEKASGETIKISLVSKDIKDTISTEEKALVDSTAKEGDTVSNYIDMVINKQLGDSEVVNVHNPSGSIKIAILIPDDLINNDPDIERTYYIIHSYDGETEIINGTFDETTKLFTFEVSSFSTFALAYSDTKVSDDPVVTDEYTITFDGNGGSVEPTTLTTVENKLPYLPEPTRENYTFIGWYNNTLGTSKITLDTVFSQDSTVYAIWEIAADHNHEFIFWRYDANGHWKSCTCGEIQNWESHTFADWTIVTQPTESSTGLRQRSCKCGYVQTEVIPATDPSSPDTPVSPD
ncbi:MAG: InlB B-repeat-containing protein, partial [Clostridia bacterium]|nr:InlB B-repeat-containing protein [Clostridia bacterium]